MRHAFCAERAFLSPELHYEATEYLRSMCVEHTSDYALLAIHKPVVKYPMRWTERGASWPFSADRDGLFIQVRRFGVRACARVCVRARACVCVCDIFNFGYWCDHW